MIALIQRVKWAKVEVEDEVVGEIDRGLVVFLGVEQDDDQYKADKLLEKILNYRIFSDESGKMNYSLQQVNGELLLVSQFTLVADTNKGLRPSFSRGASLTQAELLYDYFHYQAANQVRTATGQFAADMQVSLQNDGPVTFWLTV